MYGSSFQPTNKTLRSCFDDKPWGNLACDSLVRLPQQGFCLACWKRWLQWQGTGIRASHSSWGTDKQSWGAPWGRLAGEWGAMSPPTSLTSRDLDQTDLTPGNWLPCSRTAAQDLKIFLFGAFQEKNRLNNFFLCSRALLMQAGLQASAWRKVEAAAVVAALQWGQHTADAEPVLL